MSEVVHTGKIIHDPKKSRFGFFNREIWFVFLALAFVIAISCGVIFKMISAAPYITDADIQNFTGLTATVTDRFDGEIYENGAVVNYPVYGNVLGPPSDIHNSLLYRFQNKLFDDGINPLRGAASLESEPRVMKTTLLSEASQQEILDMYGGREGCCFAYNYETGEVYVALTAPYYTPDPNDEHATFYHMCFDSVVIPGSTMKMVTAVAAVDQGMNMSKVKYRCEGSYRLPGDQEPINCTGYHGKIGFAEAIGESCNIYFAQLIEDMDLSAALDTIEKMGFSVNGEDKQRALLDGITLATSSVEVRTTTAFQDIWGLIGQGNSQVNPVLMAQIAAAIVNGGEAAQPYIVSSITNPNKNDAVIYEPKPETVRLIDSKTAQTTAEYWWAGVNEEYAVKHNMSSLIDYAKTGTAERDTGLGYKVNDSLLMGVSESKKTAFYIYIKGGGVYHMEIANKLISLIPG